MLDRRESQREHVIVTQHQHLATVSEAINSTSRTVTSMADEYANARQAIISSLFQKFDANGQSEETYVAHVKIWEDVPAGVVQPSETNGMKPRYVIVASMFS